MSEQEQSPQTGKQPENKPAAPAAASAPAPAGGGAPAGPEASPGRQRMDPVRKWVLIFSAFCLFVLVWYMIGDRFTPFTTQARVNAFVVPIAPQVAGELLSVDVRTNQMVTKGQQLAQIDPARYQLAVASAEAQLALTLQNLKVSSAAVDAAAAAVTAAKAALFKDAQNEVRLQRIHADVPGAISQRVLESASASRIEAEAQVANATANHRKAIEALGPRDETNPQLLAARALPRGQAPVDRRIVQLISRHVLPA